MTTATEQQPASHPDRGDARWADAARVEGWAGETRVNVLRLIAIVLFYGRHLVEVFLSPADAPVRGHYHVAVTAIAVAWAAAAGVLHVWLSRRWVPPWLKYAAVLWDALMITLVCVAAGGPQTPLVLLYFGLIASAPLRWSLRLVWCATAAATAGYLFLLGYYAWYVIGFHRYYATPELRIPRSTEAVTLLALLTCGLFAGQVVRQVRRVVLTQPVVIEPAEVTA
jgi:hypothetical protein